MGPALVLPASGAGWTWWLGPPPLWALLAPIGELPCTPAWGFQKRWLKQLLKLLCLSCPLQRHGRGYTTGLSERASLNPRALQVEELCEWTLGYLWEEQIQALGKGVLPPPPPGAFCRWIKKLFGQNRWGCLAEFQQLSEKHPNAGAVIGGLMESEAHGDDQP